MNQFNRLTFEAQAYPFPFRLMSLTFYSSCFNFLPVTVYTFLPRFHLPLVTHFFLIFI